LSRREKQTSAGRDAARDEGRPRKACCMISELLEESGIDREHIRRVRRQVLQGVILLCQWQLERMDEARARAAAGTGNGGRRGRNISVE
jgi:hypothetical protein